MMKRIESTQREAAASLPTHTLVYRYLFYGWLFRDLDSSKNLFEHGAALRHNREQSRWLPTYMRRYTIGGTLLSGLGAATEPFCPWLSAIPYTTGALAVPMLLVTVVAWGLLRTRG
jgi:hypothetical protein